MSSKHHRRKKATVLATAPLSCLYKLRSHSPARPAASTMGARMSRHCVYHKPFQKLSASDRRGVNLEMERSPRLGVPTIAIEPQKHRSDVQSYSSAQHYAPPWMLKAVVVQHLHQSLALSLATCNSRPPLPLLRYRSIERGAEDLCANASCSSDLWLRRCSRDYPLGILAIRMKTQGRTCNANRCCKGIQLIHVHVPMKEAHRLDCRRKKFTGGLCFLKNDTHSRVVLHARTADVRALGTPSPRATWSSNTTDAHVAASTTTQYNCAR